ncbi:MAG: PAS domain S-box protein [Candidatus Latescibacterota bacterium]
MNEFKLDNKELQHLFDLSLQVLCIAGTDGYFKRVNPAFEKTLGYGCEELQSRPFIEFVHPDDRDATIKEMRKLIEGESTVYFENRYRCKDGSYRCFAWSSTPQHDGLLFASAIDITDRKRAEKLFRGLLEAAPDSMIIADHSGRISLVNAVTQKLFGYTSEELIGQPIEIVIPERFRTAHQKHMTHYFSAPKSRFMGAGVELPALCKDGREFPAEISLGPLAIGNDTYVFCAIRDITARKEAQRALQRSEERFDLAIQGTDAGIWDWDLQTNHVFFSPRWKSILGFEDNEISNDYSEWETRLHADDRERALATVRGYLDGDTPEYELEHRMRHKDGSYRWILARGAAVRDKDGTPYRMVGSHIDITALKRAERVARRQEAELMAAKNIQQRLLPQALPVMPGYDVAWMSYPAEFAAGDHYDFYKLKDGSMGFVISDVSGHGFSSALLMASTHAYLHSLAETETEIEAILTRLNNFLYRETDADKFVTLIFVRIDCNNATLQHGNAGHPSGYVLDCSGAIKSSLEGTGIPLGIAPDILYKTKNSTALNPGDMVLLLSDGVLEAQSPEKEFFDEAKTVQVVRDNHDKSAAQILRQLREALLEFTQREQLEDDVTALLIKCKKPAG